MDRGSLHESRSSRFFANWRTVLSPSKTAGNHPVRQAGQPNATPPNVTPRVVNPGVGQWAGASREFRFRSTGRGRQVCKPHRADDAQTCTCWLFHNFPQRPSQQVFPQPQIGELFSRKNNCKIDPFVRLADRTRHGPTSFHVRRIAALASVRVRPGNSPSVRLAIETLQKIREAA